MFAEWIKICLSKSDESVYKKIPPDRKAYYKGIFGRVHEVEIVDRKSIYYIDFQYRTYEYLIRFKNGKLKMVKEDRLI